MTCSSNTTSSAGTCEAKPKTNKKTHIYRKCRALKTESECENNPLEGSPTSVRELVFTEL